MARLLVVEDDETIGDALHTSLRSHGYEVRWERTGRGALAAGAGPVDLVLLDLGLPDLDGVEVCRRLALLQPAAVLVMLTARTDEMDVVVGLEAGADDYLTKPFRLAELPPASAPTCAATPRRGRRRAADAGRRPARRPGRTPGHARRRRGGDARQGVRPARPAGGRARRAVSRETLMADVWDENWFGSTKTLDVHIAAVRRKLAEAAGGTAARVPAIVTLRGHGYRLETPAGAPKASSCGAAGVWRRRCHRPRSRVPRTCAASNGSARTFRTLGRVLPMTPRYAARSTARRSSSSVRSASTPVAPAAKACAANRCAGSSA